MTRKTRSRRRIAPNKRPNIPAQPSVTTSDKREFRFDAWCDNMPQWLCDARDAVIDGRIDEAAKLLDEQKVEQALSKLDRPSRIFTQFEVALMVRELGDGSRAEKLCKQIIESTPHPAVYNELATIYEQQGRLNEAIRYLNDAMKMDPNEPRIWSNLAGDLIKLGQVEKGISLLRKAVEKMSDNNLAYSNLLLYMHYLPDPDASVIFEESKRWADRNAPAHLAKTDHRNNPDPDRRLKIGYISPDFRNHSVSYFFEPLLDGHNRDEVELYGYGNVMHYDETTDRLKSKFDHYRNIRPLDDKAVAQLVEDDAIDILVDLAGHSANSRISAMAYKPAPIQVTWLGYPNSTGMSQIDYRLTDSIADPPGSEKFYAEKLLYLPHGFLCYGPGRMMPPVAEPPASRKGCITFGSFNNSSKINPFIVELWARVLKSNEGSCLLLKFKSGGDEEIRNMYLERFEKFGIDRDRIATCGWLQPPAHLELYKEVDIALDTFPYNGTTTTCQALLMGVPVITMVGKSHMSRVGLSILTRVGLEFFAASNPDEYVAKAAALAAKIDALATIRATMRQRMAASALCNRD